MPAAALAVHQSLISRAASSSGVGEDRQAEGAFGDEAVTWHRLERLGQAVGLGLVVAGDDPDLAIHLDPDLGRTGDVAGGMKGHLRAADLARFAVVDRVEGDLAQTVAHHGRGGGGRQIAGVAGPGVVGVAMGDERPVDRTPRVDEEIAGGAVDALRFEFQNHAGI